MVNKITFTDIPISYIMLLELSVNSIIIKHLNNSITDCLVYVINMVSLSYPRMSMISYIVIAESEAKRK